jgi:trehalose/maltose hydrolase-like predicted phosphorylase
VAAWQLWRLLGDNGGGWLQATAWPLLSGVADFWLSKLALDNPAAPPGAPLHLVGVMPPDEYANNVTDCIWTNAGAVLSLTYAAAVGGLIGADPAALARYTDAAGRIAIPYNATPPPGSGMGPGGWHPEYAGFPPNITIKQADVVLLGFPMQFGGAAGSGGGGAHMDAATRANDLLFYGPRTDPGGPAMTWAMHAVGFAELKRWDDAAGYLNRSFGTVQPPFGVWWETTSGDTSNFITGAGGFLQAAYHGYTGLRVNDTALAVDPALPEGTGLVRLRGIAYRGNRLDVSYDASGVSFQLQAPPPPVAGVDATVSDDDGDAVPEEHRHAYNAAALEGERVAAALPRGWQAALSLAPTTRLAARSQVGRVVLDAYSRAPYTVAVAPLEVVDAAGVAHPLTPGGPAVTLAPLQRAAVRAVGSTATTAAQ